MTDLLSCPGDQPPAPEEHRRAPRRAVMIQAQLRDSNNDRFALEIVDLSQTGFRAETLHRLWPGAVVWLTIPGLAALQAVVAWEGDREYGCVFANPLYPAVFDHIIALFEPDSTLSEPARPAYTPRATRRIFD